MKRFSLSIGVTCLLAFCSSSGQAQSTSRSEQAMTDLVKEVRLLRKDLRQITTNAYLANTLIERLRLQQGQVNRLTLDLSKVRLELSDIKSGRAAMVQRMTDLKKQFEAGLIPPTEIDAIKTELGKLDQLEPELVQRESQLGSDLSVQEGILEDLNKRLDVIEQELLGITRSDDTRTPKKNQ